MAVHGTIPDEVLERHHVLVRTDNAFQRRARLLQALWREQKGLPVGTHRDKPLGSRLDSKHARETLSNFASDAIRDAVRFTLGEGRGEGQLIDEDRLYTNLLSSQPLCFNLFGEPSRDLDLATRMFQRLVVNEHYESPIARVTGILFEHSPGRSDARFSGDRSAFDVFVTYESTSKKRGFLGIEVKYHEGLTDPAAEHRSRYGEIADHRGCFVADRSALKQRPLQQIWRDHLLCGAMLASDLGYDEGTFVFLAPRENVACSRAVASYRKHLTRQDSFAHWTFDEIYGFCDYELAPWATELVDRYLCFDRVEALLVRETKKDVCPTCGGTDWRLTVIGEPAPVAERMSARGEVFLGGCLRWDERSDTECVVCGTIPMPEL